MSWLGINQKYELIYQLYIYHDLTSTYNCFPLITSYSLSVMKYLDDACCKCNYLFKGHVCAQI